MAESINKVALIVVNYRQDRYLVDLMKSLEDQSFRSFETLLINNADSSFEAPTWVVTVSNGDNRGYAAAVNQGMRWGIDRGCDAFFILNADVRLDEKCLEEVVSTRGDVYPERSRR